MFFFHLSIVISHSIPVRTSRSFAGLSKDVGIVIIESTDSVNQSPDECPEFRFFSFNRVPERIIT